MSVVTTNVVHLSVISELVLMLLSLLVSFIIVCMCVCAPRLHCFYDPIDCRNMPLYISTDLSHAKGSRLMFKLYTDFVPLKCFWKTINKTE